MNSFHAHLNECRRCREQPFDLCPIGHFRLKETVGAAMVDFEKDRQQHAGGGQPARDGDTSQNKDKIP